MLTRGQRSVLFILFCLFVVACAAVEVYLVSSMVNSGFNGAKAVSALLNGGVLYGCGHLFLQMVSTNFLQSEPLSPEHLHRFASERSHVIENARKASHDEYSLRRDLVTNALKFAEESLKGWIAGTHLELCVFVDAEQPVLFAYFDSNQNTSSRSMAERKRNPRFYLEKSYEVTRLLQAPTSSPRFVADTHDKSAHYAFTTPQQRDQVRSSILVCLDLQNPCALVISSNVKSAFEPKDTDLVSFIRFIGEVIHSDLLQADFLRNIRSHNAVFFSSFE